jgi:hypothetical protein
MKKGNSKWSLSAIMIVSIALFGLLSCSKSKSSGPTPPVLIGGYASSDSVAAGNLIAYWPFDADGNDHKGGLTATPVGSLTFSSGGVRGSAYQGAAGVYETLAVPSGSPFASLASYSVSLWYKLPAIDTSGTQGAFFLSGATTQDELVTEFESYKPLALDSVRIHTGFNDLGGPIYQLFIPETFDTNAIAKWVHLVVTYDGASSNYLVYQNAVPSGTSTAFSGGLYITPNPLYTDGTMTAPLGNLSFATDPPTTVIIGSWPDGLFGQVAANTCFLGQMDEIRVFNKALTQTEVAGLFLNGQAGR